MHILLWTIFRLYLYYFTVLFYPFEQGEVNEPVTECDHIAVAAHETFTRVYGAIAEEMLGRKILAAILVKSSRNPDGKVVALGTGTYIRMTGHTVCR